MPTLLNILLPVECLLCGRIEARVCSNCETLLAENPRMVARQGLYGFAATEYSPTVRSLIRCFKELGESSVGAALAKHMAGLIGCFQTDDITLAAVPSNPRSELERGFNHAELLAREVQRISPDLQFRQLLRKTRSTLDQSKLKPDQRSLNQQGSMVATAGHLNVVVIDDIVTTGATIKAAADAIQNAGHRFVGFVTFAETESKKV